MSLRYFGLAFLLLILPAPTSQAQTYIFGRADFAVGNGPIAVATGDLNGDGIGDLAVVNESDNTVSVLLGRPDGSFASQVTYATNGGPKAVVVGDFNGDGNLDLAVTGEECIPSNVCSPSTVSILLGNGDGSFQTHVDHPVGAYPTSLVAADFNGDGKLDLAVANAYDSTVSVLLGNGDGTFQPQVVYPVAPSFGGQQVVLGDFNGDGKLDLAVSCGSAVSVLLGNGDGTFKPHLDSGAGGVWLAAGDFNGDGKLDLAVNGAGVGALLTVLLGNGDGTFVATQQYFGGSSVAANDLRGNGTLDLIVSGSNGPNGDTYNSIAVLLGNGDGTFQPEVHYGTDYLMPQVIPSLGSFVVTDLNGDGKLDVAVAVPQVSSGSVSVLLGFGDGTFVGKSDYGAGGRPSTLTAADFNNDGLLDLATANPPPNSVSVLLGNANGTFQPEASYPVGSAPQSVAAADLRNNGDVDLITANKVCVTPPCTPGSVSVLLGNGDGTFQTQVDYAAGLEPASVAVGDFRSNGTLDLAVVNNGSSSVSILLGNGDGTFQPQVSYLTATSPEQIAIGDFNGDGKPDLAVVALNGLSILLGKGDGTFQTQVEYSSGGYSIASADFNADGKLDVAIGSSGGVSILLGNGDGTFQAPVPYAVTAGITYDIGVADFNQDGKLDLALSTDSTVSAIMLGNGDGTFQQPIGYLLANYISDWLTVGDFNGDGVPDLAAGDGDGDTIGVMLSTPFKAISPGSLNFGSQGVGTTSVAQTITITNPSNVKINVASIAATGKFNQSNNCVGSLAIGAHCSVNVTFTPTATGALSGAITMTDNTKISPLAIPLSGAGVNGPFLTPFPSRVNFSAENQGSSSSPRAVMLVNTGNAALSISNISILGADASDFSLKTACSSSLAPGASCNVNVTFTPKASGSRTARISVSDSAPGSPQMIMLSGTGTGTGTVADFAISPASGSSNSVTITAGQTASFNLTVTPAGSFSGTVNLSCAITPAVTPAPICAVAPSVNVTEGTAAAVTVKISTTAPGMAGSISRADVPPRIMPVTWTIIFLASGLLLFGCRRRMSALAIPTLAVVLLGMAACGGGGGSGSTKTPGSPAGTYSAVVTAKSGSLSHSTTLTVIVQ